MTFWIQGALLTGALVCACISDVRTHVVSDWIWIIILFSGLIGIQLQNLPGMLTGGTAVLGIHLVAALVLGERALGGADIKISAAGAFLLGGMRGLYALILGLTLAVIIVPLTRLIHRQKDKTPFPLVPFLAIGILTVYWFL